MRGVLETILRDATFDGAAELRAQVPHTTVAGGPVTFLQLAVEVGTAQAPFRGTVIPGRFVVGDSGELLVWVSNGYLSALEFAWVKDDPPTRLPDPELISVLGS